MKKVYIIHGWDGHPQDAWIPWLKKELETKGFEVTAPQMPHTEMPNILEWANKLKEIVKNPDEDTYIVCHSMGCKSTAKFLEGLSSEQKVGGVLFLAGFFKELTNLEVEEPGVEKTAKEALAVPVDFQKIRSRMTRSVAIFSDNDRFVPLSNVDNFKNDLGSEIHIVKSMDHFWTKKPDWAEYHTELPLLLDAFLTIVRND